MPSADINFSFEDSLVSEKLQFSHLTYCVPKTMSLVSKPSRLLLFSIFSKIFQKNIKKKNPFVLREDTYF
jgi:hypothetical protein